MNTHGSSSSMQAVSRPLASAGVLGHTTLMPGVCINHASSDCECCAPKDRPAATTVLIVRGTPVLPPDMYRSLAAWLATWSMHTIRKSMNMISATGRRPSRAAPMAVPTIAVSEIGVSRTRPAP